MWRWLRPLVAVALLAVLVWRVDWREIGRTLTRANWTWIAVAWIVELLSLLPRVWRWRALLATQGSRLPLSRLTSVYMVGSFFSNFLPSDVGGDGMRMWRLAQATGQGADAVSSVFVERLCGLFAVLLLGSVAVLGNWRMATEARIAWPVLLAFAALVLSVLLLCNLQRWRSWSGRPTRRWAEAGIEKLSRLYDSIQAFRREPQALLLVIGLSVLYRLINVLGLYTQALALNLGVSFVWLMMAVSLIAVVSALPLSVNALGIKEGAYIFFFGLVGIAAPEALALALLSRAVTLSVSFVGGALYLLGK